MSTTTTKRRLLVAVALVSGIGLAGCGGGTPATAHKLATAHKPKRGPTIVTSPPVVTPPTALATPRTTIALPTTTLPRVVTTTTTPPPSVANGQGSWSDANVTVTGCTDSGVTGKLVNTGSITNTYIIEVTDDSGSFELGSGNTEVTNLPAGQTATWTAAVSFSNSPTGPVTCSVDDVLTNY
jgi:hypothetical protein